MSATQKGTLVATGLGLFMIFLDALIVNVALPDIQKDFGGGEQDLQWVVAAYSLGMAMCIMSAATFADLHGRRRVFVVGVVVFTSASVVCGIAPGLAVLNIARGVQGIAAAVVNVTSLALVSAAFPDPKMKARAIGLWTAIASLATAIGPTVGGLLTEGIGWRAVFLVNLPVGLLAIALTFRFVAESKDPADRTLDGPGQILFIIAIGALAYGLIEAPHAGWTSPLILALFAVAVAVGTTFVAVERRRRDPMMDVTLFKDRTYATAIITIFVQFFAVYGMLLVITQYLQNVEGYSPAVAGPIILPFSLAVILLSPVAGWAVGKFGTKRPILLGIASIFTSLLVLIGGVGSSVVFVLIGLGLMGIGGAFALTPVTNVAMSSVPEDRAGMASGIMSAQRAIGSTVGFAVLGSLLAAWLGATLQEDVVVLRISESEAHEIAVVIIREANPHAMPSEIAPSRPLDDEVAAVADADFVEGIRASLGVAAVVVLGSLVLAVFGFPGSEKALDEAEDEAAEAAARERRAEASAG